MIRLFGVGIVTMMVMLASVGTSLAGPTTVPLKQLNAVSVRIHSVPRPVVVPRVGGRSRGSSGSRFSSGGK